MGRKEEGREGGREGGRGKKEGKRGGRKGSTGGEGEREQHIMGYRTVHNYIQYM